MTALPSAARLQTSGSRGSSLQFGVRGVSLFARTGRPGRGKGLLIEKKEKIAGGTSYYLL